MDRTETFPHSVFEGWNIGAVSVKRVRLHEDGTMETDIRRHGGDPACTIRLMLDHGSQAPAGAVVTGSQSASFLSLPYLPESICLETALDHLGSRPDLVLSLGGESFIVYCMADGTVRRMISSNRCAAGSGEFLVQQFGRMNLDLVSGIAAARQGRPVALASRCSVHCKSDATHKLNKGECTPADIACSLIVSLAAKVAALIVATGWRHSHVLLAGGLARSAQLVAEISSLLPETRFEVLPQSGYLEAAGATVAARRDGRRSLPDLDAWLKPVDAGRFSKRPPLSHFCDRVIRIQDPGSIPPQPDMRFILGVDAGSTTTKAILLDRASGRIAARCYLRTYGNPVQAAFECIADLERQVAGVPHRVVQAAVTGSGREIVPIYLDNCTAFNEILAHARAARELVPDVDTLFEIGGQDAKFVALQSGIPLDYSMNDGSSTGTGSLLDEAAASDMQVPIGQLGPLALSSANSVAFGERCAAFINSEVRSALQAFPPNRHSVRVIEADGDSITTSQLRQLETVAVQCRRRREALNERPLA